MGVIESSTALTREVDALLSPRRADDRAVMRRVSRIVDAVRAEGDGAVRRAASSMASTGRSRFPGPPGRPTRARRPATCGPR